MITQRQLIRQSKYIGLLILLILIGIFGLAWSGLAATTTENTAEESTTPTTVVLEVTKKFSGSQEGFTESEFSFQISGDNGVNEIIPHGGNIELLPGSYSMEEVTPRGFDVEDWRIAWYGDTCEDNDDNTASLIIEADDPEDYAGAKIFCEADNQFRPKDGDNGGGDGATPPTYTLEGYVWHDVDEDGEIDEDEPLLEDWEVVAQSGTTTLTTETNGEGYYSFTVPAGKWTLSEVVIEGWEVVFPTDNQYVFDVTEDLVEIENNEISLWWPFNLIFTLAHAQVAVGGPFNFGNVLVAPTCNFTVSNTSVSVGDTVTLNWNLPTATSVVIDQGIGSTTASGTQNVTINNDITYTLTANFAGGVTLPCPVSINVNTSSGGGGNNNGNGNSGGGNGASNNNSGNTSDNNGVSGTGGPTPLVLGEQVSVVPRGGANAGAGGSVADREAIVWTVRFGVTLVVLLVLWSQRRHWLVK